MGAVLVTTALAGGVRIVDRPEVGPFGSIQQAIDAAIDGETLLVGAGSYSGFVISDRELAIVAAQGASVIVQGTVEVEGLLGSRGVVLSGLEIRGNDHWVQAGPALVADSNAGHVWVLDCVLRGGAGLPPISSSYYGRGGDAVILTDCSNLVMARCTVRGGAGGHDPNTNAWQTYGGYGGKGLDAQGSQIAILDCDVAGGTGGAGGGDGGDGGRAIDVLDHTVFLGGTKLRGGDGGSTWDYLVQNVAKGGHGLYVDAGAQAWIIEPDFAGGAGGSCGCQLVGKGGRPMTGTGILHPPHPGPARELVAAPITSDAALWQVTATGIPGDRVYFEQSRSRAFVTPNPVLGMWLVPPTPPSQLPYLGTIGAGGVLHALVPVDDVTTSEGVAVRFAQGAVVDALGRTWPSSPTLQVAFDARGGADCDGNGRNDLLDVMAGVVADVDHDLVPDSCATDCNQNGTIDGLDIASGASLDVDHDLVPDECEVASIWYVDDSAAQGGDGSLGAPFRSLRPAFAASLAGDTVLVHDGTYRGKANRGLDFEGRDRVVASIHGSANCVIDLEQEGRAFRLMSNESSASEIRGFTFLDGRTAAPSWSPGDERSGGAILAQYATPTVSDCEFHFGQAEENGGALVLAGGRVERCTFVGNSAVQFGGAILAAGPTRIVGSHFQGNSARQGGALLIHEGDLVGCTLIENAGLDGGAIRFGSSALRLLVTECLIAGNTAQRGAGIFSCASIGSSLEVRGSTLVGNVSSVQGAALLASCQTHASFTNSVVRGNLSSTGHQAAAAGGPGNTPNIAIAWTDWQDGSNGVQVLNGATLTWGAGNIDLDPLFVSPAGPDGNPLTYADNDYRLAPLSPCVDAGDNASIAPDVADLDLDGNLLEPTPFDLHLVPRTVDDPLVLDTGPSAPPVADLGAYERQP